MKLKIIDIEETIGSIDSNINSKLAMLSVCNTEDHHEFRREAMATLCAVLDAVAYEINWLNELED